MAKVYDALKQVEAERSRQLSSAAEASRQRSRPVARPEPNLWKRFSGRFAGQNGTDEPMPSEVPLTDRSEAILTRLDTCEQLVATRMPELEQQMRQHLESRIGALERESAASLATLSNQMRRDVAMLNRRVSLLAGGLLVLLTALLLRT